MVTSKTTYVCTNCNNSTTKWSGKCGKCEQWNCILEIQNQQGIGSHLKQQISKANWSNEETTFVPLNSINKDSSKLHRIKTNLQELDRITGGGFVPGSVNLIGGEPGIGKSTLLLQVSQALTKSGHKIAYATGEESLSQISLRAKRLKADTANIYIASQTCLETILELVNNLSTPTMLIIDSIQSLWSTADNSEPGSVRQLKLVTQSLVRYAKSSGCIVVIVGHITKDGTIAGPKVIEHMVDSVLYFFRNETDDVRLIRPYKNRFGSTQELGVFEMSKSGLLPVNNPSQIFLTDKNSKAAGVSVFAGNEGSRSLLFEIQALVIKSFLASPRRNAIGWDQSRLSLILAVLQTCCGLKYDCLDVYIKVAGGIKLEEPATDLAIAAALISAYTKKPCPAHMAFCGEISLTGTIRICPHLENRKREATKCGYPTLVHGPYPNQSKISQNEIQLNISKPISNVQELSQIFLKPL